MLVQSFPKPKLRKHHARNNPKPTADDICTECGIGYAELHEVFFGPYRQLSIKYKLQERLCSEHHRGLNGPHHNRQVDLKLKRKYQAKFEQEHGHEFYMKCFMINYL